MKLEINSENFRNYIKELNLVKKNNLIICIPTFNSFEITINTIRSYTKQIGVSFDIMVIGPSGDIEKIKKEIPEINFCLTKDNYGSSGNQLLNIEISKFKKYQYTILTDNDAVLIDENGISKMLNALVDQDKYIVIPSLCDKSYDNSNSSPLVFHCTLYSNKLFEKMEYYFNPNYFIFFDDIAFFTNIYSKFRNKILFSEVRYYHPKKFEKYCYDLKGSYLFTRSILLFLIREKIPLKERITYIFIRVYFPFWFTFFIKYNVDYLGILLKAITQVLTNSYDLSYYQLIKNKFSYSPLSLVEIQDAELCNNYRFIENTKDLFLAPKIIKYIDSNGEIKFFKKVKI